MIIFQREVFDEDECFELCKADLSWWVKIEESDPVPLVGNIIRCSGSVEISSKRKKRKEH